MAKNSGRRMSLQDCGRAYDRVDTQNAVRNLMRKMNIEIVDLPDAREKSVFCGPSFLKDVPNLDKSFAPKRYGSDAQKRGIFIAHEPSDIHAAMIAHAETIPTEEVCCYCFACDMGLEEGGKDSYHLIELVSGRFRDKG